MSERDRFVSLGFAFFLTFLAGVNCNKGYLWWTWIDLAGAGFQILLAIGFWEDA